MKIKVLFFASLRELVGTDTSVIESASPVSLGDIWSQASGGKAMPANTLCALNMEYVRPDTVAGDGDEVAFFPPVTGGETTHGADGGRPRHDRGH